MLKVTCFGEVLWDVFPDRKNIGGAPLNVALRLNSFGIDTSIISKIGSDNNGENAIKYIQDNGLNPSTVQVDQQFETGVVDVKLDKKGSASYEIKYPVAWDKIEFTEEIIDVVKESDAFVFGSLACRDEVSRNTLFKLLERAPFKVFDANLRPPHYSFELLMQLMEKSDFIKLNDEELVEVCEYMNFKSADVNEMISHLSKETNTSSICVTKGGDGASLLWGNKFYDHSGYKVLVKDTVGAGDSFLASLIYKLLSNENPKSTLSFACAVGSLVASKEGANPILKKKEINKFLMTK